jgi:flagellar hook-associated protein 3 FlgL
MTRIGSLGQQETIIGYVRELQSRLAEGQIQLASGVKTQTLSAMAPDAPRLLAFEDSKEKYTRLIANVELAEHRGRLTELNLSRMEKIAREMTAILQNEGTNYPEMAAMARNYLREFADLLNLTDDGRALFAGANTAGPAVTLYSPGTADPAAPFAGVAVPVTFDSYRYKVFATGVPADTAIKVSDTLRLNIQPNFASPAVNPMTKVLDALIRVADFGTTANLLPVQADVDAAKQQLTDALIGVAGVHAGFDDVRTQLALDMRILQGVKESHNRFIEFAIDTLGKLTLIDKAALAARMNGDQVSLEASYAALARLTQISLLDFLK